LNKTGLPKFNMDYLRKVIPEEHFHNLGYLGVIFFLGGFNLIAYSPLLIFAYIYVSDYAMEYLRHSPNSPIPSFVRPFLQKGVTNKPQLLTLKADLEIYVGIYLIIGWFFGWSSLVSIIFFWQFIRLKYMLNNQTQQAFVRFKGLIDGYVNAPSCPGIVKTGWRKCQDLAAWSVKFDQQQQ